MLFVISPAKSLDFESAALTEEHTQPKFVEEAGKLVDILRHYDASGISNLMGVSDNIAELNAKRYKEWRPEFSLKNAKQAIYAFKGDVYTGISIETASANELDYIKKHVRILSGLYGVLEPLDLMQAYRLEMGTKLENNEGGNLYKFWGAKLTEHLNKYAEEAGYGTLVNLASNEYFKAVKQKDLSPTLITPVFKDLKGEQYKIVSFFAKKARGLMVRFAADHQVNKVEQLKEFDYAGYAYNDKLSSEFEWVFTRDAVPAS